jgi:hypothetical protein
MIAVAPERAPFVEFKMIAKDDPVKSHQVGYRVTKDVAYAFITQPGSKDQFEYEAEKWLDSIKHKAIDGHYPQAWVDAFNKKYEAWKEGREAPLDGTSVREWPLLSPAQAENFVTLRILTIEDVAAMTEEAMARFGMGSRNLREKAKEWLQGKQISDIAMQENIELKKRVQELEDLMKQMLEAKPKKGRPPKIQEAA